MGASAFTCKVCGQEFWHEPTEMLRILPDHPGSAGCRRARRRLWVQSQLARLVEMASRVLVRRPVEPSELVITVPMDLVTASAPGPINLRAPPFEEQLSSPAAGCRLPPLRWRRALIDRLRAVVNEQLTLAERHGLRPERPVSPAELRRWSRCRAVYPDGPGAARRAQGQEEVTILMAHY